MILQSRLLFLRLLALWYSTCGDESDRQKHSRRKDIFSQRASLRVFSKKFKPLRHHSIAGVNPYHSVPEL